MLTTDDNIIHRSKHTMIVNESEDEKKRRMKREQERSIRGWRAPDNKPYLPLGDFENVVPVIDTVKEIFPNINGMGTEAMSNLKQLKSNRKVFTLGPHPRRVMKILESSKPIFEEYTLAKEKQVEYSSPTMNSIQLNQNKVTKNQGKIKHTFILLDTKSK